MLSNEKYVLVEVALPVPSRKTFTYLLPKGQEKQITGKRVMVPLGPRTVTGLILGPRPQPSSHNSLKKVFRVLDKEPLLSRTMIDLGQWISDYYMSPIGETLRAMLPPGLLSRKVKLEQQDERLWPTLKQQSITAVSTQKISNLTSRQREILNQLSETPKPISVRDILERTGCSRGILTRLVEREAICIEEVEIYRSPWSPEEPHPERKMYSLSPDQKRIGSAIDKKLQSLQFSSLLIHGVTGSGKTEVYLNAIAEAARQNRSALILVPEIGLTPQTSSPFRAWFGDRVAILHSKLSKGERFDEWRRIRAGIATVVIGTRSAIFAPVKNLGIIIVDEEHDGSYKQDETPRYNARDVAFKRGQKENALVILGSATPQLEISYKARFRKSLDLELMPSRINQRPLPTVHVIDMRQEFLKCGHDQILSGPLLEGIRKRLDRKQQVLLLLNRRGYSVALLCRSCGYSEGCPHCSISLTFHQHRDLLSCHCCGYSRKVPKICSQCHRQYLHFLGIGTEKLQGHLKELFPKARVGRLDRDTTRRKGEMQRILAKFTRKQIDILVGTQMIAKGHDFPKVTLVGVLAADQGLRLADFRGAERTFQLLTQVAGRSGRGDSPGEVIVQTHFPNHYSLKHACSQNYESFYQQELQFRKRFLYPPFTALANLTVKGSDETRTRTIAKSLAEKLIEFRDLHSDPLRLRVLGPAPCPLERLKGNYRFQVLLKTTQRSELNSVIIDTIESLPAGVRRQIAVDIDPINLL